MAIDPLLIDAFISERQAMLEKDAGWADLGVRAGKFLAKAPEVLREGVRHLPDALRSPGHGIYSNFSALAGRITHPIAGLREGWRNAAPLVGAEAEHAAKIKNIISRARDLGHSESEIAQMVAKETSKTPIMQMGEAAAKRTRINNLKWEKGQRIEKLKGTIGNMFSADKRHLLQENVPLSQIRNNASGRLSAVGGTVKELAQRGSRSGWTGAGRYTKYMPVGNKGMNSMFAAMVVPDTIAASKKGPVGQTGSGGTYEAALGGALGTAGWISAGGLGLAPGAVLGLGGHAVGARIGRTIDRMRSGASLRTAFSAPTREEAMKSVNTADKYYGSGAQQYGNAEPRTVNNAPKPALNSGQPRKLRPSLPTGAPALPRP